jgi:hypothetical protein
MVVLVQQIRVVTLGDSRHLKQVYLGHLFYIYVCFVIYVQEFVLHVCLVKSLLCLSCLGACAR